MRIGILSMQRINNYGSFLQALGLKKEIERLGHEVVFVDFDIQPRILEGQKWKNVFPFYLLRRLRIIAVRHLYYKYSPVFYNNFSVLGLDDKLHFRMKVDILVIGSDEVFNFIQDNIEVGCSPELLGAHHRARKLISYAASCGNLTYEKVKRLGKAPVASKLLKRFAQISVRDENTANLVKQLTGRNCNYHLDPVLVSEYGDIFEDKVTIRDYIIVYGYHHRFSDEEGVAIKKFAEQKGKKIIALCARQSFCDTYIECSPLEILAYFKHADYIITDTFHGTIFSILNHKQFLTVVRTDRQTGYGNEGKLFDLLKRLELCERQLFAMDEIGAKMEQTIDYERVDVIRMSERERTRAYLKENLSLD